ncbi:MAG: type I methionyl aminopeptidase, partial [Myxococcales bacterium]
MERPIKLPKPNDPCWCGTGRKYKKCHLGDDEAVKAPVSELKRVRKGKVSPMRPVPAHIPRPDYVGNGRPGAGMAGDPATRLQRMRNACRAAADILAEVGRAVQPGVTTDALDALCHEAYIARGGYPSPLGYRGFPKSLCTSVNEVVVHGIPDDRPLERGDIVNLDVTIYLDGMHGDTNATFVVGETDPESERLIRVTRESLMKGIEAVKVGQPINVIGRAIEQHASRHGLGVVRDFCGHGIGEVFHTPLQISH